MIELLDVRLEPQEKMDMNIHFWLAPNHFVVKMLKVEDTCKPNLLPSSHDHASVSIVHAFFFSFLVA